MDKLTVVWSDFAATQLEVTYHFIRIETNKDLAKKEVNQILESTDNLAIFPNSGKIEPTLINETKEYRFLVKGHYKIIYTIEYELNEIRILDLFDSRQNPSKIKRSIDL